MSAVVTSWSSQLSGRSLGTILAEWREAEREMALAPPHSDQWVAACQRVERLRSEYRERCEAPSRGG